MANEPASASASLHSVTAFFDERGQAAKARADLLSAGFRDEDIVVKSIEQTAEDTVVQAPREGVIRSLLDIFVFMPPPDQLTYAEALHRGGAAIAIRVAQADYERAIDILDRDGAINLDERELTWRAEGWRPEDDIPAEPTVVDSEQGHDPLVNPQATGDMRERIGVGTASTTAGLDSMPGNAVTEGAANEAAIRDTSHGRDRVRSYRSSAEAAPKDVDPQI